MKSNTANRSLFFASLSIVLVGASLAALGQQTAAAGQKFQPLAIKPGLWESTITVKTVGELPIPAGMLGRLTPEQRARLEERMRADSAGHANTTTDRHCVTREDLEQHKLDVSSGKECTPTVTTSTSSVAKGTLSCATEGMKGNATFEAVAMDSEHVKGSAHGTMTGSGHTLNVDDTFNARWLSSSCGNVR